MIWAKTVCLAIKGSQASKASRAQLEVLDRRDQKVRRDIKVNNHHRRALQEPSANPVYKVPPAIKVPTVRKAQLVL